MPVNVASEYRRLYREAHLHAVQNIAETIMYAGIEILKNRPFARLLRLLYARLLDNIKRE